jgi:hypothetical protein
MKRRQKQLCSLFLAAALALVPVSQSLAAVSYDASSAVSGQVLFPGDSLINYSAELPVVVDGEEVATDTPGTWVNQNTEKVFTAATAEDGTSLQLTTAGYVLVVKHGTSSYAESNGEETRNHYEFQEDDTAEDEQDIAYYPQGTTVKLTADAPEEGMEFAGWQIEGDSVTIASPEDAETTMIMPEEKVTVTALYQEIPAEAAPETEAPQAAEEVSDENADSSAEAEAPAGEPAAADVLEEENDITIDSISEEGQEPVDTYSEEAPSTYSLIVTDGFVSEETGVGPYAAGTVVTVNASDYSADSLAFAGWSVDSLNVDLEDLMAATITFAMPEGDVYLTAHYQVQETEPAQSEVQTELAEEQNELLAESETAAQSETQTEASAEPETEAPVQSEPQTEAPVETEAPVQTETTPVTKYTVQVANGTISGVAANADGTYTIEENTPITINANAAAAGSEFAGWTITDGAGNAVSTIDGSTAQLVVTVSQNLSFAANYTGIAYDVTVTNGTANYTSTAAGTVVTVTADQAPVGMEFASWTVNSGNASLYDASAATTSFTMPAAAVALTATYRQKSYTLTVQNGSSSSSSYYMDDEPVIKANYPDTGKEFDYWTAVSGNVEFDNEDLWKTSFSMPASDVTVKAVYKDGPSTDNNLILDLVAGGEYYVGSTIKFTASGAGMDNDGVNPGDYRYRPTGYQIGNVTGSWQGSPYTTSMAIKAVGEYTLKVTFAKEVYDGENWTADGTTDTKSVTFYVVNDTSVATGDDTPIATIAAIAGGALLVFLILLVVLIRRRRRK